MQFSKIALLSFALFVVAACGGTPAAPTGAPATATPGANVTAAPTTPPAGVTNAPPTGAVADVCALLSAVDLETVTGNTYLDGLPDPYGQCYWDGNQIGSTRAGDTIVGAVNVQTLTFIKGAFSAGGSDVTVSGHPAFYNPTEGLNSLWVDLGNGSLLVLSVPMSNDLDPSYQDIVIQLAEIALTKM